MAMIYRHYPICWNVESTSGRIDGWGLLYRLTLANAVTNLEPPDGFFMRKDGLRYSIFTPTSSGCFKTP